MSMEDNVDYKFADCYLNLTLEEATDLTESKLEEVKMEIKELSIIKKS